MFDLCADYVLLETGEGPNEATVAKYFDDIPKGVPLNKALKLGMFSDGRMVGLLDLVCGYPNDDDWYIGLLLIAPVARNRGFGKRVVDRIVQAGSARKVKRVLLAVLEENTAGRAFWSREGFSVHRGTPARVVGQKTHVLYELVREL